MKRIAPLIIGLIIGLHSLTVQADERPVYPGRTVFLETFFSVRNHLSWEPGTTEGELRAEWTMTDLWPSWGFSLNGGYGFGPTAYGFGGLKAALHFSPASLLRISPYAGFQARVAPGGFVPALELGAAFDLHLHERNYLSLGTGFTVPLSGYPPRFVLSAGLGRVVPIKLKTPRGRINFSVSPLIFTPDGDGRDDILTIALNPENGGSLAEWSLQIHDSRNVTVRTWQGRGAPPDRVEWDGLSRDGEEPRSAESYDITFYMADILGNVTERRAQVETGILVRDEGGSLKIVIPQILFPPNSSDFTLLSEEDRKNNRAILTLVLDKLIEYPEYNIRIEGHGNLFYWDDEKAADREQKNVLVPLSEKRAEAVKEALVDMGADEERITTVGLGGAEPLVPFSDEENRWKNRRVEFELTKPASPAAAGA